MQPIEFPEDQIKNLRPTVTPTLLSHYFAQKLRDNLLKHQLAKTAILTFGVLDIVQAVQSTPYVEAFYISGWQVAASAVEEEVGPDVADYNYTAVPKKVKELSSGLLFHDRKQRVLLEKKLISPQETVDYLVPLIADADTSHSAPMKLTKLFIEAGVAACHFEDQRHGMKRCGHIGSKTLVPISEHIMRLRAARLQADLMRTRLVIIARTDAESAKYIDNTIDARDQPYILGTFICGETTLTSTFPDAIQKMYVSEGREDEYDAKLYFSLSLGEAMKHARKTLRTPFSFEWDSLRTPEGFYPIKCGLDYAAFRAKCYAPFADMLWVETSTPSLRDAHFLATSIHSSFPKALLAYNLSPSFNWDGHKMSDQEIKNFSSNIAKMGFVFQFITLAGIHLNGLAATLFARGLKRDGMLAYVEQIQREERKEGVALLQHQRWSGADLLEKTHEILYHDSSHLSLTKGSTEHQQFSKL